MFSTERFAFTDDIAVMNRDGTQITPITQGVNSSQPAWSPDGSKMAFLRNGQIYTMNADGTAVTPLTTGCCDSDPDWQPLPINYYPRPKGATPLRASLTIAYQPCTSPNREHGGPITGGSCNPPQMSSQYLTVGTGDANGMLPRSEGAVRFDSVLDKPATPADESDMKLELTMSDVFTKTLAAYSGELRAEVEIQATDKNNTPSPGGPGAATTAPFALGFSAPCVSTDDTTIGSDCGATTSANALLAGMVAGGYRAIWQLGQVKVYDGGSDSDGDTTADNTLFADEGVFAP